MERLNLTNLTANVNNIQALSDRPNTADGLTPQELKERFDKAGADIKDYINNTQIEEIEDYCNNEVKPSVESLETSVENLETSSSSLSSRVETLENANFVRSNDSRLSNSRQCNNAFDNWSTARGNLKISYGTSLPGSGDNGSIFFLY